MLRLVKTRTKEQSHEVASNLSKRERIHHLCGVFPKDTTSPEKCGFGHGFCVGQDNSGVNLPFWFIFTPMVERNGTKKYP